METLVVFFASGQALGALIGAATAVWSELAYVRARRDGRIDAAERMHLDSIARGLRFGMTLLLLSSFGLIVVNYELQVPLQPAFSPSYWVSVLLALFVVGTSWALSRRLVSFALGSAVVFSAWWFLVFLTLGQLPPLTFGASVFVFIVATALFYALLRYARFLTARVS